MSLHLCRLIGRVTLVMASLFCACAQAGVMTRERMVQPEDMGRAILFLATMPARACINELVISPTHNRFYLGGLETPPPAKT